MKNPVDKSEKPQQNLQNNRRTVHSFKDTFENYKEENPVDEGEKPHKLQNNRRTEHYNKNTFENYKEMKNPVDKSNKPQNLQINRRQMVNSSKEAFENYKEKKNPVENSEEDLTVPRVKRHIKSVHELPKSLKPNGNKNETNLKKHIKHEPPDGLSKPKYDKKVELMEDSEVMDYDSIVIESEHKHEHPDDPGKAKWTKYVEEEDYNPIELEMFNIKYKTNLKQHINSEHKHEPPDDLSKVRYDEKV